MLTCVTIIVLDAPHHRDLWLLDGVPIPDPLDGPPERWILESAPHGPPSLVLEPGLARVRLLQERCAEGWPRHEGAVTHWRQAAGLPVREPEALRLSGGAEGLALKLAQAAGVSPPLKEAP